MTLMNTEHYRVLRKGVDAWHWWREENRETIPNLRDAYLAGMDLEKVNLSGVRLGRANLVGVSLKDALLTC